MSRKTFNDEEVFILRQNPFTYNVTHYALSFTKEFKELFIAEYNAGKVPRQILIDHSYDQEILGNRRIWGISQHIRQQYAQHGEFSEDTTNTKSKSSSKPLSEKDELKQLRHEIDYMKQEIDFLKKFPQSELQGSR